MGGAINFGRGGAFVTGGKYGLAGVGTNGVGGMLMPGMRGGGTVFGGGTDAGAGRFVCATLWLAARTANNIQVAIFTA